MDDDVHFILGDRLDPDLHGPEKIERPEVALRFGELRGVDGVAFRKEELAPDHFRACDPVNGVGNPREDRGLGVLEDVLALDADLADPGGLLREERTGGGPREQPDEDRERAVAPVPPAHYRNTRMHAVNTR